MVRAYPAITVHGFDLDEDVIALARANAETVGLAGRLTFSVADASDPDLSGTFDLVTVFEALHDMSRPVESLRLARGMLADGGSVVIADELVEDVFTVPAPVGERISYAWSVVSCLPSAMGDPETAATGAVMRPLGPAALRGGGRVRRVRDPADRDRLLAVLSAAGVVLCRSVTCLTDTRTTVR